MRRQDSNVMRSEPDSPAKVRSRHLYYFYELRKRKCLLAKKLKQPAAWLARCHAFVPRKPTH